MITPRHIAVIDIGKTNAKLALVDLEARAEVAVVTRPNTVLPGPPWGHFDTEGHWAFLLEALKTLHRNHGIDAISVTTHGASIVLLDQGGNLAAPILDYEHPIPADIAQCYDAMRPDFAQTGSPRLAGGLNVGAQLHYQFNQDPTLHDRTDTILGYPQYWGFRLTGEVAYDVTSIGCHTDLWHPQAGDFSDLADKMNIADKIAPVRKPDDILGTLLPEIAGATDLPKNTPVAVGIHDSNASLYPHILAQNTPFSVVSTGTWVIAMAVGGKANGLDPNRDTLVNVNALGDPVPSARFMGGREYELIQAGRVAIPATDDVADVLASRLMLLPAVEPLTGPFQGHHMRWTGQEPAIGTGLRAAALSFYLAMMTDTCLSLTGADGPTIVEGPFARNPGFKTMLAAATGRPVLQSDAATGTAIGAALLFERNSALANPAHADLRAMSPDHGTYASEWRHLANSAG
ncbi:FGGY-family carbohydrate kinase [Roseobacter weihaiensis]|uniref:FGGY-family carbohydrate kinase n=1 Tax=Roseobacter weihaiensis TaxID=2763262 RepID=UPI001D0ADFF1|nr:FGGY-family carbohydrate kinase [Roseobacter sp. H9]